MLAIAMESLTMLLSDVQKNSLYTVSTAPTVQKSLGQLANGERRPRSQISGLLTQHTFPFMSAAREAGCMASQSSLVTTILPPNCPYLLEPVHSSPYWSTIVNRKCAHICQLSASV